MTSDPVLLALVEKLQRFPELAGCPIGYEGRGQSRVLVPRRDVSSDSWCVAVVIEEIDVSETAVLDELAELSGQPSGRQAPAVMPSLVTNRSRLGPELVGAGIGCGLTIVSAFGVAGGIAGAVPTAGASTFLVVAAWTGLTMGAVQCLNGLVRVGAILVQPDDNSLHRWDSNLSYSATLLVVDSIGIASGVGSLSFAARSLWAALMRHRGLMSRGLDFASLRAMNRIERLRAISQAFEEAAQTPGGRETLVRAARAAGVGSGSLQRAGLSVRNSETLVRVISDQTVRQISSSLRDVLTGVASVGASATPARLTGSASGAVNYIINLIDAGSPNL